MNAEETLMSCKKRLSVLIYSLDSGGAEKVVSILINELQKQFEVVIILMNDTIKYDLNGFDNIVYMDKSDTVEGGILKFLKIPFYAWKYRRLCAKLKIDVSLSLLVRFNFMALVSKLFGNRAKIIISEHSFPSMQYNFFNLQCSAIKYLIKKLYPYADQIISVSQGVTRDLMTNFYITNRITTISNPVDLEDITRKKIEKVDFDFSRFTFITIGRLDSGKNHKLMIKAFSRIKNRDTQLIIIGEGSLRQEIQDYITFLKLEDRVFLAGYTSNPYSWLHKSDCFVLTSSYESFGIVLIEALACGLPVISTDCQSGPREILDPDGQSFVSDQGRFEICRHGILTRVHDIASMDEAMDYLIENPELLEKFRSRATDRALDFDSDIIKKDFVEVLKN